jgi:hypothetical protein
MDKLKTVYNKVPSYCSYGTPLDIRLFLSQRIFTYNTRILHSEIKIPIIRVFYYGTWLTVALYMNLTMHSKGQPFVYALGAQAALYLENETWIDSRMQPTVLKIISSTKKFTQNMRRDLVNEYLIFPNIWFCCQGQWKLTTIACLRMSSPARHWTHCRGGKLVLMRPMPSKIHLPSRHRPTAVCTEENFPIFQSYFFRAQSLNFATCMIEIMTIWSRSHVIRTPSHLNRMHCGLSALNIIYKSRWISLYREK